VALFFRGHRFCYSYECGVLPFIIERFSSIHGQVWVSGSDSLAGSNHGCNHSEVLEQIEVVAERMQRSDAVAKVYDSLRTQSVLFAYFAGNTIYLVSDFEWRIDVNVISLWIMQVAYLLGVFFFLRPYELPLHVSHLISSVVSGVLTVAASHVIV
jgi:hypothetical protein